MNYIFTPKAEEDLDKIDNSLRVLFIKHAEKLLNDPIGKHLKHGLEDFVEKVTKEARMPYKIEGDTIYLLRCFTTHKEYQKWYETQKR